MKRLVIFCNCCLLMLAASAQKAALHIEKGNQNYKKKEFIKANEEYNKALQKNNANAIAQFNSGNAKQRLKKYDEALQSYEAAARATNDPILKAKAFYNQGLSYISQKKLTEAIDAFKRSLRLNANDDEARENLQKALKELKQQQSQSSGNKDDKNKKKPDNKQKQQNKSQLSKEEAEKMLNHLSREEKNLQKQLQKKNQSGSPLKDW